MVSILLISRRSAPGICALLSSSGVAQLNILFLVLISSTSQLATVKARPETRHANGYNNGRKGETTTQNIMSSNNRNPEARSKDLWLDGGKLGSS